ncbi:ubiquinol-cytochrome c reductase iron-sulfur subunit [Thermosulfuriphilus ammonigenes]|uniref:Ubiquinol-cytochrome c reductase iron-sulfur subunit n=1 Tax=Thermosulfuriphilus ammonigenes TaxID=1936021 RepID=A0A6G7PVL7_9BACT|nr:ubiquinol-cytochrome c reductase iron-sulfur subunit [Thermosulfuriphilus ammonigenes]MBA2848122.1 Rieske Fe-S protein [Thermosulfuriphilus ammonigenes]QIJ71702.1 ubiquinol-cytochrome c reductase iron-sulfur subunit [Thermosulfuriphilus ammonigenes]
MIRRRFLEILALGLLAFPTVSFIVYRLPRPPRLKKVKVNLKPGMVYVDAEFFLLEGPNGPLALLRRCPHLGCPVSYQPEVGLFVCPCHQSRFKLTGRYVSGPAKKDLRRLTVEKKKDGYVVEIPV